MTEAGRVYAFVMTSACTLILVFLGTAPLVHLFMSKKEKKKDTP